MDKQWGDDWNDAPYESNAGEPYGPREADIEAGTAWEIKKMAFDAPSFYVPCEDHLNSSYSVQDINAGVAPWLRTKYAKVSVVIPAGTTFEDFISLIKKGDGKIYQEVE